MRARLGPTRSAAASGCRSRPWMLTIAWLPVATALTGQTRQDPLQLVVYIGTMALTCVTLGCARALGISVRPATRM
ncbi:hypothetical protein ACIGCK_12240 [Microbacterium sp. NPDC078428]|uniref:hypothetical protein n=1 Tax=Microbacterium sp. NPDC078428 TaxID=3364190 RepID=UPI0037C7FD11